MSKTNSMANRLFWGLTVIGFLVGLVGLWSRLTIGHTGANYGSYIPWGLWVAGYIYLVGLSEGAFFVSALVYVFKVKALAKIGPLALLTALASLLGALVLIWMDLGHMERVWRMIVHTSFHSVMGWMAWLYGLYVILLLVQFWFAMRARMVRAAEGRGAAASFCNFLTFGNNDVSTEAQAKDSRVLQGLGIVGLPLAVAFTGSVGAIFGVVGARPYWNSGLTPVIFLIGAMLSGSGLLTMVVYLWGSGRGSESHHKAITMLGRIIFGLLALDVILEWAEISIGIWSSLPSEAESVRMVIFGDYSWVFWGVHVALGVAIPGLLLLFKGKSSQAVAWAGGLIAVTFLTVRLNIVLPGQAIPELEGLRGAFTGPGLLFTYFPSINEWLLFVFAVSLSALVFMIGKSLLPVADSEITGSVATPTGSGEAS